MNRLILQTGSQFRNMYTGCFIATGEKPKLAFFPMAKSIAGQRP